jgi:enoyl-CoA hydratase
MMADHDDILFDRIGGLAIVTLNRPQALNAFTLGMYRRFDPMLRAWANDPAVRAVLIRGAGDRAFCAGGDVRAVYEAGRGIAGPPDFTSVFFREEYEVIRRVHRFPKPYLAVIDGIAMGGGMGVSVNGAYRVVTENAVLAMPETAIGLFPDVGATRFLNLCPGRIGLYLALSGARLRAADALYCGLATHFAPRERIVELTRALGEAQDGAAALLAAFAGDAGPAPLASLRPAIDRTFAGDTVEAILDALAAEAAGGGRDAAWAAQTRDGLTAKSPTSLKITLRQLALGKSFELENALTLEYRMTQHVMTGHDFYEGVRAMLIDKDQQPRWRPATLAEIGGDLVERHFVPLGERELRFA